MTDSSYPTAAANEHPDYLRDESRREGSADAITFARSEPEVRAVLAAADAGEAVTVQGARTGISGGAVPDGGRILNLSRMTRIDPVRPDTEAAAAITAEPGALLADLRKAVEDAGWFFPPDPTETSASLGGMAACNASGARSFFYGPTRAYVTAARVVLADGDALVLRRGVQRAVGRRFRLETESGRTIEGDLPSYTLPAVKNTAGYCARDDMDMLDLFVGADGTLGVFTELEMALVRPPATTWGLVAFLPSEAAALDVVDRVRASALENEEQPWWLDPRGARPRTAGHAAVVAAVEFFDCRALNLLRSQKASNPAFEELPDMKPDWHTALYIEVHAPDDDAAEALVVEMSESITGAGGDPDATWLASDEHELERLKTFRHAVPESVNLQIDERRKTEPGLTKLGTDLAVPDGRLREVMALYHESLDAGGFEYVIFGHIGNNHVHVNILPGDLDAYRRGKTLYRDWARQIVAMGGTVSAEHGIGKLKTDQLAEMYGTEGIEQMRAVKHVFDPEGILNRGNLF